MPRNIVFIPTGGLAHNLTLLGQTVLHANRLGIGTVLVDSEPKSPSAGAPPLAGYTLCEVFSYSKPLGCACWRHYSRRWGCGWQRKSRHRAATFHGVPGPGGQRRDYRLLDGESQLVSSSSLLPSGEAPVRGDVLTTGGVPETVDAISKPQCIRSVLSHLRIQPAIQKLLFDRLPNWAERPFIAAHFRNTDYRSDLETAIANVRAAAEETGISTVFWATDDTQSIQEAQEHLPELVLRHAEVPALPGRLGLHVSFAGHAAKTQFVRALEDLYLLSLADVFLASTGPTGWKTLVPILREPGMRKRFFGS